MSLPPPFSDDIVLFSKDPMELQSLLDKLYAYSTEWGLKVNIRKTKVCVFENRRTQRNQRWLIHGEPLETRFVLLFRYEISL